MGIQAKENKTYIDDSKVINKVKSNTKGYNKNIKNIKKLLNSFFLLYNTYKKESDFYV